MAASGGRPSTSRRPRSSGSTRSGRASTSSSTGPILDAVPVLAGIAAVTERILLGPAAILTPLRHPTMLAKELATLDIIAGGRLDRRRRRGRRLPEGVRGRGSADGEARAPHDRDDRDHAQVLDRGDVLLSRLGVRARGRLADAEAGSGRRTADLARRAAPAPRSRARRVSATATCPTCTRPSAAGRPSRRFVTKPSGSASSSARGSSSRRSSTSAWTTRPSAPASSGSAISRGATARTSRPGSTSTASTARPRRARRRCASSSTSGSSTSRSG